MRYLAMMQLEWKIRKTDVQDEERHESGYVLGTFYIHDLFAT